jgi:hypothetical protein
MSGDDKRARPASIGEYLFNELRQAFQDIRQKVLEEGWFGRVVTAAPVVEIDKGQPADELAPERRASFEELWSPRERAPQPAEQEHSQEMDFDR